MTSTLSALNPQHEHGLRTIAGYSIVLTDWSDGLGNLIRWELARVRDAAGYGRALELRAEVLRGIEDGEKQHVVIDNVYVCGCRSGHIDGSIVA